MNVSELLSRTNEAVTVRRVFGEPYDRDGLTVIPAASVGGGGGGGSGHDEKGGEGEGGGYSVRGRPAGAFVIRGNDVTWQPAVDPNRIITVVGIVVAAYLLTRPRLLKAKARLQKLQAG